MQAMHPIRARAIGALVALSLSLKKAKEENKRGKARDLQEAVDVAEAKADRAEYNFPEVARGQQVGIALVDAIATKHVPEHCRKLAQMIGARLSAA